MIVCIAMNKGFSYELLERFSFKWSLISYKVWVSYKKSCIEYVHVYRRTTPYKILIVVDLAAVECSK